MNKNLDAWIEKMQALCKPEQVVICNGNEGEYHSLTDLMVKHGTLIRLKKRKNSFLARSNPYDVARVEGRTFICSDDEATFIGRGAICSPLGVAVWVPRKEEHAGRDLRSTSADRASLCAEIRTSVADGFGWGQML